MKRKPICIIVGLIGDGMIKKVTRIAWILVIAGAVLLVYLRWSPAEGHESEQTVTVDDSRYAYRQLPESERAVYRKIVAAIEKHEVSADLGTEDPDRAAVLVHCVVADYPEFYWVTTGGKTHTLLLGSRPLHVTYAFNYTMDAEQKIKTDPLIAAAADRYLALIRPEMSDYEKVKTIYDAIVVNTEYNLALSEDQTICSVLLSGEGVCSGYAKTMQYLLNKLGIFCTYVTGDIPKQGSHAWNLVRIDGDDYFIDPTWGDPVFSEPGAAGTFSVCYDYFCITTEDLRKTHTIDMDWEIPECTATACNYFVKNGLMLDRYDTDRLLEIIGAAAKRGESELMFQFSNAKAYDTARSRLFDGKELSELLRQAHFTPSVGNSSIRLSYTLNDDLFIIRILAGR